MFKHIRLVAVDLDDTVLRSDGSPSPFTAEVFRRLRDCQISTCVLTARREASAEAICGQLTCRGAAFYNGAVISADNSVIASHSISWQTAKEFLSDTEGHPCSVSCEDGTVYTNFKTHHSIQLNCWSQLPRLRPLRIVLYRAPQKLLEKLTAAPRAGLYMQQLAHGDILAVSNLAKKEQALKTLLEHWKLSPEEVVGFGDDANDLGFLTLAGTGIAVQNAEGQIREKADIVCGSNDQDGPAQWLNRHVLEPLGATVPTVRSDHTSPHPSAGRPLPQR